MFTWKHSETITVQATAAQVWAMWSAPETWPAWDSELEWVTLDGSFREGTKGSMKPRKGPKVVFELVEVKLNESFTDRARLPFATLDFGHHYVPANSHGSDARITHTVEFRGLLALLFGRLIGRDIKRHLRPAMLKLAQQALTIEQKISRNGAEK